ncbi:hypothetical protein ACTXT7_005215 [Hymenolepis weldensis]
MAYVKGFAQFSSSAGWIFIDGNLQLLRMEFFEHPGLGSPLVFQAEVILLKLLAENHLLQVFSFTTSFAEVSLSVFATAELAIWTRNTSKGQQRQSAMDKGEGESKNETSQSFYNQIHKNESGETKEYPKCSSFLFGEQFCNYNLPTQTNRKRYSVESFEEQNDETNNYKASSAL